MADNFKNLFYPESVAVIGASTRVGSVGNDVLKNLIEQKYTGKIYPVNPKTTELYGLKCFADVNDLPENVDLAIIIIPAALVPDVLDRVGKKKIKSAIVISAGFKESGAAGVELELKLKLTALMNNITLIGPNCLGLLNPEIHLNASFAKGMPEAGSIAFISQSGALCTSVLDYAKGLGVGFSKFISIGNKTCIDEIDLIRYLADDPYTKVIMMYEEQLSRAADFIQTIGDLTTRANGKPVISLKAGRTTAGATASASHTGALGGDDAMIEAVFRKAGVTRAYSIEELFDYAITFAHNPPATGKKIAIITNAGGPGVITTDEAMSQGLELAHLSEKTEKTLLGALPQASNIHNPVDVLGDADAKRYSAALDGVMTDPGVDGVIVILTPQSMTQIEDTAREIVRIKQTYKKPLITSFMGMESVREGIQILQKGDVATIAFPEYAARSMSALVHFSLRTLQPHSNELAPDNTHPPIAAEIVKTYVQSKESYLKAVDTKKILEAYGFLFLKESLVTNKKEAKIASAMFEQNVVLKVISRDIVHKSDVGGVALNIEPKDIVTAYDLMMKQISQKQPAARIDGILVQELAPKGGFEFIIGGKRDDNLGVATIMVGMGGIYVEVLKDVAFGVVPMTRFEAESLIEKTKASMIISGVRGQPPLDRQKLIDSLGRISALFTDIPQIHELDINPLLVYPTGATVIDARIKL